MWMRTPLVFGAVPVSSDAWAALVPCWGVIISQESTPPAASASRFGVCVTLSPQAPPWSARRVSTVIRMTFGGWAEPDASGAGPGGWAEFGASEPDPGGWAAGSPALGRGGRTTGSPGLDRAGRATG